MGSTSAIVPDTGYVQKSRGALEQPKQAQSIIVDDTDQYGKGTNDLAKNIEDFGLGSIATGIVFVSSQFSAFVYDWDENDSSINAPVVINGIKVAGWDTCKGGYIHVTVSRAYADTIETLLGK